MMSIIYNEILVHISDNKICWMCGKQGHQEMGCPFSYCYHNLIVIIITYNDVGNTRFQQQFHVLTYQTNPRLIKKKIQAPHFPTNFIDVPIKLADYTWNY